MNITHMVLNNDNINYHGYDNGKVTHNIESIVRSGEFDHTGELTSDEYYKMYSIIHNNSSEPKRIIFENEDGERVEFTTKQGYIIYVEK